MRIKLVVCVINKKQFNIFFFYYLYAKFLWRVLRYVLMCSILHHRTRDINDLSNVTSLWTNFLYN